jgi:cell wall-associated NlpC family hydrolase
VASASAPPELPAHRWRPRVRLRTLLTLTAATLAATVAVVAPALPAQAKPTAAQITAQIADLNDQIETVVEQYNGISTKLAKDEAQSAKLKATLGTSELQSTVAQNRITTIVRDVYMAGPTSGLAILLETDSTQSMLDTMGVLEEMARSQKATISSASALVDKYQSQSDALDKLIAAEQVQKAQLASKKADILGKLASLKKLQDEAGGGTAVASPSNPAHGSKSSLTYRMPVSCPQAAASGKAATAVAKACSLVKTLHWYGWAEAGPSEYDCSGLTMTAWKAAGVSLDHFTGAQYSETTRISRSELKPGDLVFYYSNHHHVAIYIGNGWIVQAEETGEPIKESPIDIGSLHPSAYGRVHT